MTGNSGWRRSAGVDRMKATFPSANMACAIETPCALHAARIRFVSVDGYETVGTRVRRTPKRVRGNACPPCGEMEGQPAGADQDHATRTTSFACSRSKSTRAIARPSGRCWLLVIRRSSIGGGSESHVPISYSSPPPAVGRLRSRKNSFAVECRAIPSPRKCVLKRKKSKSRISAAAAALRPASDCQSQLASGIDTTRLDSFESLKVRGPLRYSAMMAGGEVGIRRALGESRGSASL